MKSLEIVNANIEEYLLKIAQLEEDLKICSDEQEENILAYLEVEKELLEDWKTIKADLEVLEIIKNKNVNLIFIRHRIRLINLGKLTLEEALDGYNFANEPLTMEELLKLKQWLEENENDR